MNPEEPIVFAVDDVATVEATQVKAIVNLPRGPGAPPRIRGEPESPYRCKSPSVQRTQNNA